MATHSSTLAWKIPWMEEPGTPKELDTTERLHFRFSLLCIGERNGNPLQCSCLENPRDGGAWWAAVSGVLQSRTQLRWLSSSSNSSINSKLSYMVFHLYHIFFTFWFKPLLSSFCFWYMEALSAFSFFQPASHSASTLNSSSFIRLPRNSHFLP